MSGGMAAAGLAVSGSMDLAGGRVARRAPHRPVEELPAGRPVDGCGDGPGVRDAMCLRPLVSRPDEVLATIISFYPELVHTVTGESGADGMTHTWRCTFTGASVRYTLGPQGCLVAEDPGELRRPLWDELVALVGALEFGLPPTGPVAPGRAPATARH